MRPARLVSNAFLYTTLFPVEGIGPRTANRASTAIDSPAASNAVGSGKATLRLRPPVVETQEVT